MPANVPAIWVWGCDLREAPRLWGPRGPVAIRTVQDDWGHWVLFPGEPLEAGASYGITRWPQRECLGASTGFRTTAPADLPSSLGALFVSTTRVGPSEVATSSGTCTTQERGAAVDLGIQTSPALAAFAPVLRTSTFVDGQPWCGVGTPCNGTPLVALCGPATDEGAHALAPGIHRVQVAGEIVGGPSLGTSTIDVRLCCDSRECPDLRMDAGPIDPSFGPALPLGMAPADPPDPLVPGPEESGPRRASGSQAAPAGCDCSSGGEGIGTAATLAAMLALGHLRPRAPRRRRR